MHLQKVVTFFQPVALIRKAYKMKSRKMFRACFAGTVSAALLFVTPAMAQQLSDPEIASVAVTANKVDIGYAELAQKKSKDPAILEFAQTMAKDHKGVIDQAVALVTKLNVTPKDNAVSKKLNADAEKTKKELSAKSGAAFNKAYIDNEVAYHKAVISVVESTLIPQSQNAELKALLQQVLPVLKTHLDHAVMVQGKIKG
jgi:putative membrane protein